MLNNLKKIGYRRLRWAPSTSNAVNNWDRTRAKSNQQLFLRTYFLPGTMLSHSGRLPLIWTPCKRGFPCRRVSFLQTTLLTQPICSFNPILRASFILDLTLRELTIYWILSYRTFKTDLRRPNSFERVNSAHPRWQYSTTLLWTFKGQKFISQSIHTWRQKNNTPSEIESSLALTSSTPQSQSMAFSSAKLPR